MWNTIKLWIKDRFHRIFNSIAFYPALIGVGFLVLSFLMITFDFSEHGKQIKSKFKFFSLNDPSTARSIISAIAAGIISLAVFSFSMVMIVLNQAASQMSNRILDKLIGNRFQQVVLGIYIGTIVYAFFLLSTIRDIDSGIYIPALSTYTLIVITIFDIFLFIYFLHYITQSVKYEVIVDRIYKDTLEKLESSCCLKKEPLASIPLYSEYYINSVRSGIFEDFDAETLIKAGDEHDCVFSILHTPGTFIMKGLPLLKVSRELPEEAHEKLMKGIYVHTTESIESNFFYGFRQLMEVAIKALSPGINDPGTAIVSLRALFQLFAFRAHNFPKNILTNQEDQVRVLVNPLTFEKIFTSTMLPIWDYGKRDRMVQHELYRLLNQLQSFASYECVVQLFRDVCVELEKHELR
jgi:uncharacterized membrane protein